MFLIMRIENGKTPLTKQLVADAFPFVFCY